MARRLRSAAPWADGLTIGLLTTSYPRFEGDVAGLFVRGMARALARRGHRVEVLAPAPEEPGRPLEDAGVRVRWIPYMPRGLRRTFYGAGVPDNVRRDPRAWPGLLTYGPGLALEARRQGSGWDAVISHWAVPCGFAAGASLASKPHLAVLHSADVHVLKHLPLRRRWARALGAMASEMWFASAALRRQLLSWLPEGERAQLAGRTHSRPMGIDPPRAAAKRAELRRRLGLSRFTVLSVGRLVPIKGLEHAIEAVAGLDDAELWVVGDGPERSTLEARAAALRAPVRFLGTQAGERRDALLVAADTFVAPSLNLSSGRTEGTPTALLEAAAAGLPIVASAVGGVGEVFAHERSALLVPPGDASALRDALRRLRAEPDLRRRLSDAARPIGLGHAWSELAPWIEQRLVCPRRTAIPVRARSAGLPGADGSGTPNRRCLGSGADR